MEFLRRQVSLCSALEMEYIKSRGVLTLYVNTIEQTMHARALRPIADAMLTVTRVGRDAFGIGWTLSASLGRSEGGAVAVDEK